MVRMEGYSDFFNDMNADLQGEIISKNRERVFLTKRMALVFDIKTLRHK
jgi:hypothetical protein